MGNSLLCSYFCYLEGENRDYRRNFPAKRDVGRGTIKTMKKRTHCDWRLLCRDEEGAEGFKTAWVHFLKDGIQVLKRW